MGEASATRLPSIRRRVARTLLGWSLLAALAIALAVAMAVREEVDELLDDTLRASADVLGGLLATQADAMLAAPALGAQRNIANGSERFAWQLIGVQGEVLLHSPRAPAEPFRRTPGAGFAETTNWRVFGRALGDGRLLVVAQSRAERAEARFEAGLHAVLAALAVGLLGYFPLRATLRQELAPLQTLSQRLSGFDPLQADASLGEAERAELAPVHGAINGLAQRLARRVASERGFSAHAAHALRTPLAGIDAQLAVAQRECPPALLPRLTRVRDATRRLQQVVAALLTLFRSGAEPQRQHVAIGALVGRLPLEGLALDVQPGAAVDADPDLLAAALLNLLDNALRHGAHRVRVTTPAADCVRLHDDGPGLPAERRRLLQQALDSASYQGQTGLGLMLADVVARAHGGRLMLPEPDDGHGFVAELRLAAAGESVPLTTV